MRRIEAVTGAGALGLVRRLEGELRRAGDALNAAPFEVAARVAKLQAELREREKEIEKLRRSSPRAAAAICSPRRTTSSGVRVLATRVDVADAKALRESPTSCATSSDPA